MTANPGRLALCDHPGCTAEFRIYRGEPARLALETADWTYDPEFCPEHKHLAPVKPAQLSRPVRWS